MSLPCACQDVIDYPLSRIKLPQADQGLDTNFLRCKLIPGVWRGACDLMAFSTIRERLFIHLSL